MTDGDRIDGAWADSFLAALPAAATEQLLSGAWTVEVPTGEIFYRGARHSDMAMLGVITDGLVRTFMRAPDGRQVTIRYAGRGAVIGIPALLMERSHVDVDAQAIRDTTILRLPTATFRALAKRDPGVAWPVAAFLAEQIAYSQEILANDLFMDVRARVARHLLDLAIRRDGVLAVTATHQDLADAIGSVREVVSRAVMRLQDEALVERMGARMVIRDPAALHAISACHHLPRRPIPLWRPSSAIC